MAAPRSTTQELSDTFYSLQIIVKIIEGITNEYDQGVRTQDDFENRFHSQVNVLCRALESVRPLTEKLISEGYSKYEKSNSNCTISDREVHTGGSSNVVEESQVQSEES